MKQDLICITCPMGCHLCVDVDDNKEVLCVSGNGCPRGEVYARKEVTHPERMLTSTVKIKHGLYPLLPVMTASTIPKELMVTIMREIQSIQVSAPIEYRQVIKENIAGSGVSLIASRSMEEYHGKSM